MVRQPVLKMLPWSWHKSPGYVGQFERLERWYMRARQAKEMSEAEDYLYAFFQGCNHLREWLPEQEFPEQIVREFLAAHIQLKVCRDLANLTKHRELKDKPSTRAEPSIARIHVANGRGWFGGDSALVALTDISDRPYDLLELADRCLTLWSEFLISARNPS
jgi:hypothetical protein